MRIALVIERIDTWRGGAETSSLEFAGQLIRRGVQVHLITRSPVRPARGMSVQTIPAAAWPRVRSTAVFLGRAAAACRAGDFDLIHAISPCPVADVYQPRGGTVAETIRRNLALRRSTLGRALKRIAALGNLKQRMLLGLERSLLQRRPPPIVAAVSEYVARQVKQHYHVPDSAVRVIFNGIELDEASESARRQNAQEIRCRFGIDPADVLALCVAHNFRLKGVGRLIEAMALAAGAGDLPIRLLVLGRDNPKPYQRLARRYGLADRVCFAGPVQRTWPFFYAADMCIHPTYYDPCSRVVLEALAAGVPCITTRYNGAAEIIEDGRHGYVIDSPDDTAALADRIRRLTQPDHRRQCATAAAELRARLSMARHVDEMLGLYDQILAAKARR